MTLALCENEGRVDVTGLEIADVPIDGDVCGLDGTGDDDEVASLNLLTLSLCVRSNGRSSKIKIYRY